MKRKIYFLFVYCFAISTVGNSLSAQIPSALKTFIHKKNLQHAGISFKALDLVSGKTLAAYNENMSLVPASNMKIVTTATALDILGADFHFETPVLYDGLIQDSVLEGNLYIQGSGDPTLGSQHLTGNRERFLQKWLIDIQKAGIQCVRGDVIVLDQLFGYEGISHKWLWEDLGNYYAPGIYGISVFDNLCHIYLQSYSSGSKTEILSIEPQMEFISFTNNVIADTSNLNESSVFGLPFSNERRLYGTIPANKSSISVKSDLPDPGLFLAKYFITYLQKNGIEVEGKGTTYRLNPQLPADSTALSSTQSPALSEIIRVVNVESNNHYAEHLFRLLTLVKKTDIPDYWKKRGLNSSALFMQDGSGISPLNGVSAGFLTDLLIYMNKKGSADSAFYKSLPIAGQEGTVASFLKDTSLSGKAHIKSGSITGVQSYSGYIEKGNKRYVFSLIVNHFSGQRAALRKDMEELLVELFR